MKTKAIKPFIGRSYTDGKHQWFVSWKGEEYRFPSYGKAFEYQQKLETHIASSNYQ